MTEDIIETIVAIRKVVAGAGNADLTNKVDAIIAAGIDVWGDCIADECHPIYDSYTPW